MDNDLLKELTLWHNKNKYEKIINKIMEIPEPDRDYDLVCHLARALNNQDKYSEAINYFLSVQEQGQYDPLWHYRLGYAYYYIGKYKEAIVAFEEAVALNPEDEHSKTFLEMSRNAAGREGNEKIRKVNDEQVEGLLEVDEKINQFSLVAHNNGSISMILSVGEYKRDIFQTRAEEGVEGNGYDWASLATVFLNEKMPHLVDIIRFDPEADMFAAYTDNREAMFSFAIAFNEACEDDILMKDLFSRAELD
ncbi:tetratricopeptide repeat protein [Paenibacillus sp. GSMTC-2017]|uniref:Imm51 family immunity protein n=1 Tax=Paenibacillus sp. GSMTC-2017 TaxID=2794350 RepID=UPI0018D7A4EE|nr:Imm51 family immunity protein [Paenibacillus sp. GSMTC-2017]MBH5316329.1 tetratricopeptide repeat protein [Paenibacillus sp. GSMTC-2017]